MKIGETIELGKWEIQDRTTKAGFKMPKGKKAVFLLLGVVENGADYDPNAMLRSLGWELSDKKSPTGG